MNQITLTFDKGTIDLRSQEISLSYENWRFSDGLKEAFSTDFSVPKTSHNISVLNAVGLLDSSVQPQGTSYNGVLSLGSEMMAVRVQFVSMTEDTIDLCLFEKTFSEAIDGTIKLRDTQESIFPMTVHTQSQYPDWFPEYDNGSINSTPAIVPLHPSKSLSTVLQEAGYNIQLNAPFWRLIATDKYVCPENTIQVIEGTFAGDNILNLAAGQHITNDAPGFVSDTDDSVKRITFNRSCIVSVRALVYVHRGLFEAPKPYTLYAKLAGQKIASVTADMTEGFFDSQVYEMNFAFRANDTLDLYFELDETRRLQSCNICCELQITDYKIYEEDYKKEELVYLSRYPRLVIQGNDDDDVTYWPFDGSTYMYKNRTHSTPSCAWSYFGYYCNIPDETIPDFVSSVQWILGKRATEFRGEISFVEDSLKEIDGQITKISTSSEKLGKKNYILYEDEPKTNPVSEISNEWLEDSVTLKDLKLANVTRSLYKSDIGRIEQYEVHYEDGEYKADFHELENFAIMAYGALPYPHLSPIRRFSPCGIDNLTQSVEVTITTFDDVKDCDYVYLHGRKFMVVSTDKDIEKGETTITALLIPTK